MEKQILKQDILKSLSDLTLNESQLLIKECIIDFKTAHLTDEEHILISK
jgi:hypothetical protein